MTQDGVDKLIVIITAIALTATYILGGLIFLGYVDKKVEAPFNLVVNIEER